MPVVKEQLLSQTVYDTDGVTTQWEFNFAGGYIDPAHVKAYVLRDGGRTDLTVMPDMLIDEFILQISPALAAGGEITIYRDTPRDLPLVDFQDRGAINELSLDTNAKQAVFVAAEVSDQVSRTDLAGATEAAEAAALSAGAAAASAASAAGVVATATAASLAAQAAAADAAASVVLADAAVDAAEAAVATVDTATIVRKDADTGAAQLPAGTTAQRGAVTLGRLRFNTTTAKWEGANGASWANVGDPTFDGVFFQNSQAITQSRVIPAGKNEFSCGPITIPDGLSVTVSDGAVWTVI